jgi:flagellar biosynthesis GTPase FlhF
VSGKDPVSQQAIKERENGGVITAISRMDEARMNVKNAADYENYLRDTQEDSDIVFAYQREQAAAVRAQLATSTKEIEALEAEQAALFSSREDLSTDENFARIGNLKDQIRSKNAQQAGVVSVKDSGHIQKGDIDPALDKVARDSTASVERLVSGRAMPVAPVNFERTTDSRAYHEDNTVFMHRGNRSVSTGVHELGHHLESKNSRMRNRAQNFLADRTGGDDLVTLNSTTRRSYYASGEVTRPDRFISSYN